MDKAAPPRPSPSARVNTMPDSDTRAANWPAMVTASWPVRLSATNKVSVGAVACSIAAISAISASSILVRPAVSSITTSKPPSLPACTARLAISTGDWPSTIGRVSTSICSPKPPIAAWRQDVAYRARPSALCAFHFGDEFGNLAGEVVLPEPCRPTIIMTTGGTASKESAAGAPACR